jgi:hypothetical protein
MMQISEHATPAARHQSDLTLDDLRVSRLNNQRHVTKISKANRVHGAAIPQSSNANPPPIAAPIAGRISTSFDVLSTWSACVVSGA